MKCFNCQKEMERENDKEPLMGIEVNFKIALTSILPEDIEYYNKQLGKYSDGNGGCHVCICYECYIDTLFRR